MVTNLELIWYGMRMVIYLQISITFWSGRRITSLSYHLYIVLVINTSLSHWMHIALVILSAEICTAEPLVHEPSTFEVETAIAKLNKSCMYNEYTISIFRFLKLSLHDSRCFSPAVYLTALFCRIKILLVSALALCPHTTIPYDRRG
jgi:hypothetical protein